MTRHRAAAHAARPHKCVCGRVVFGNGGWASHTRACIPWLESRVQANREAVAKYEAALADDDPRPLRLGRVTVERLLAGARSGLRHAEQDLTELVEKRTARG